MHTVGRAQTPCSLARQPPPASCLPIANEDLRDPTTIGPTHNDPTASNASPLTGHCRADTSDDCDREPQDRCSAGISRIERAYCPKSGLASTIFSAAPIASGGATLGFRSNSCRRNGSNTSFSAQQISAGRPHLPARMPGGAPYCCPFTPGWVNPPHTMSSQGLPRGSRGCGHIATVIGGTPTETA